MFTHRPARSLIDASGFAAILATVLGVATPAVAAGRTERGPGDIPLANWHTPAYWAPARPSGGLSNADSSVTPLALPSSPLPFVALSPCRVLDTRGFGFSGQYGPPTLVAGGTRAFTIAGQCGVPVGAQAVSVNVTVTGPFAPGFVSLYPTGTTWPGVSTVNYVGGQTIANSAIIPLGADGAFNTLTQSKTDLIVDINGYFADASGSAVFTMPSGATSLQIANRWGSPYVLMLTVLWAPHGIARTWIVSTGNVCTNGVREIGPVIGNGVINPPTLPSGCVANNGDITISTIPGNPSGGDLLVVINPLIKQP